MLHTLYRGPLDALCVIARGDDGGTVDAKPLLQLVCRVGQAVSRAAAPPWQGCAGGACGGGLVVQDGAGVVVVDRQVVALMVGQDGGWCCALEACELKRVAVGSEGLF